MSDTRQTILEQLAAGAISVEEAAIQLNALRAAPDASAPEAVSAPEAMEAAALKEAEAASEPEAPVVETVKAGEAADQAVASDAVQAPPAARRLRIIVTERASNRQRVHISLPLGLVRFGLDIGEKWGAGREGWGWQDLRAALEQDGGVLMDVDDDDQHVEIRID